MVKIPKKVFDGNWWKVPTVIQYECPQCGAGATDRLEIMRYREERTSERGGSWARKGWRLWWGCNNCYWMDDNDYATTEELEEILTKHKLTWESRS